ncbi:MAG: aldose 1-epimerase [Azospirillaceae bacterium]
MSSETIELLNGDLRCLIAPAIGGSVVAFDWRAGDDWVPLMAPTVVPLSGHAAAMANFPLVPFSNRVAGGRFTIDGVVHAMPINAPPVPHTLHGDGWQAAWRVVEQGPADITLRHDCRAPDWPHVYEAWQSIALAPDRLDHRLEVINRGDRTMPFGLGLHPYFPRRPDTLLSAPVETMDLTDETLIPHDAVPVPEDVVFDRRRVADLVLDAGFQGFAGTALIEQPALGYDLRLSASANCRHLVVYVPPGEAFFCVEPVTHRTDAFNAADPGLEGIAMLAPGEGMAMSLSLALEPR